jgi:hypothetical protein
LQGMEAARYVAWICFYGTVLLPVESYSQGGRNTHQVPGLDCVVIVIVIIMIVIVIIIIIVVVVVIICIISYCYSLLTTSLS